MKNGKASNLEARMERLEKDVKEIRAMLQSQKQAKHGSWKDLVGMFANDPVFEEVDRIVRDNREKDRRRAQRKQPRTKTRS